MTTAGGGHKRKTVERGLEDLHGARPLNICPDWKGLGMQRVPSMWRFEAIDTCIV